MPPDTPQFAHAITTDGDAVLLRLKVVPNSSRTRIVGMLGDRLKIAVAAPPESGKANKAVCQLLANMLKISQKELEIVAGLTQPMKTVRITALDQAELCTRLSNAP